MASSLSRAGRAVLLLGTLVLVAGCVDDADLDAGLDSGAADTGLAADAQPEDLGSSSRDVGAKPTDAGPGPHDQGTEPPPDMGGPQVDLGPPPPEDLGPQGCEGWGGVGPSCALVVGVCAGATRPCVDGDWAPCGVEDYVAHDARYAEYETAAQCDGLDNDCDGTIDEDCLCLPDETEPCATDEGECQAGVRRCDNGRWTDCDGVGPTIELCDGLDNDCDGDTDEVCDCQPGETEACGSDVGECRSGLRRCDGGHWAACSGVEASPEECNGRDDDCDGSTDDDAACPDDHRCVSGSCQRERWVFEAESGSMGHDIGRSEAEGWSASTGPDAPGYLVYGPYTDDLPAGRYQLLFRLMTDNVNADDNRVVRLEVNDFDHSHECGDCILARTDVRRRSFAQPMQYQDFVLTFANPGAHRLEFRTYWQDIAYVRQDRVTAVREF